MITIDFNRLSLFPGCRVLDVGCGSGRHTGEALRKTGVFVVGMDLCLADLFKAKDRLFFHESVGETGGGTWHLAAGDATNLPFGDAAFDGVICSEVLEHVPNHRLAARELMRVLRPGGFLAVSVPRAWPERLCWNLSFAYRNASGGHIRIYTKTRAKNLFTARGARFLSHHYAHGLHSPYWWLKCAVGPDRENHPLVGPYTRFLTWDMMKKPRITSVLEQWLNPFMGKSLVLYFTKKQN